MTDTAEQPRRGRPPKAKAENGAQEAPETRRERRRKDGDANNAGMRLSIPDWVRDKYPKTEFKLAWITEDPARMAQKYNEDWDPVAGVDPIPGAFSRQLNKPVNHILHAKRMEWVESDRVKAEARRKRIEEQAATGKVSGKGGDAGESLSENISYADASNRLR